MGSDHADHVHRDMDGDQVAVRLTARQRAIVEARDIPRSMAELMQRVGVFASLVGMPTPHVV